MVQYKLNYYNLRGRGEPIRIIFAYLGVPYEDNRIELMDWPDWKPKFLYGQVPVLQADDFTLCQSTTIARFISRKYGLTGANEFEAAKCDEYVDAINDMQGEWRKYKKLDEEKQAEGKKQFIEIHGPKYLNKLSSIKTNNVGSLWLVGHSITWADLILSAVLEYLEDAIDPNLLEPYPVMKALKQRVFSIPKLKEYLEQRPVQPPTRSHNMTILLPAK